MQISASLLDKFLLLPLAASLMMMADKGKVDAALTSGSATQVMLLAAATLVVAILAVLGTKIDRRCTEDYIYQILSNAALIAVVTAVMMNMAWGIVTVVDISMPRLTGQMMTGIVGFSWCTAYYWYRWRGVQP